MFLQILYPFFKDFLALTTVLIGLKLLYATMKHGIANAKKGPKAEPMIQNIHGLIRTGIQDTIYNAGNPKMMGIQATKKIKILHIKVIIL